MYKTDYELGRIDGNFGNESRYPHNINYMKGFARGTQIIMARIDSEQPFESMLPYGISDAMIDQHNA